MIHYKATPTSREELSNMANRLRSILGLNKTLYIPIVELLEFIFPQIDKNFDYEIVEQDKLPKGTYALTYPDDGKILIRSDVYEEACSGKARARFTIAHELCHYLIHESANISFARTVEEIPAFMNPEWQANVFAAEFLIPKDLIKGMTIDEVVKSCGVSYQCASIQMKYYGLL